MSEPCEPSAESQDVGGSGSGRRSFGRSGRGRPGWRGAARRRRLGRDGGNTRNRVRQLPGAAAPFGAQPPPTAPPPPPPPLAHAAPPFQHRAPSPPALACRVLQGAQPSRAALPLGRRRLQALGARRRRARAPLCRRAPRKVLLAEPARRALVDGRAVDGRDGDRAGHSQGTLVLGTVVLPAGRVGGG